jgi:hypothetical protein
METYSQKGEFSPSHAIFFLLQKKIIFACGLSQLKCTLSCFSVAFHLLGPKYFTVFFSLSLSLYSWQC